MQKVYQFACRFIQIFSMILLSFFFFGAFLTTAYSLDMEFQKVLFRWDNPFCNLLGMGIFLLLLGAVLHLSAKGKAGKLFVKVSGAQGRESHSASCGNDCKTRGLTVLILVWCLFVGAVLIVFSKTVPAADALSVYSIAEALAGGDTSVIHPTDSYLSYYPQQVGLTLFFELLIRLCNLLPVDVPAYHFIKCLYVLLACVIILFQKKTVHLLWESEKADRIYLLLAGMNLPFLLYTSFVYGEIPSFTAVTLGFYFLAKLWKKKAQPQRDKFLQAAAALLCMTLSVMLRKNNLILVIAVLLVVFLEWLKSRRRMLALWGILCGVCCLLILPVVQKSYEIRAGNTLSQGVTAMSYFAMGMQESSRANGWYNGFNFNTYHDSGMDTETVNEISRGAVRERLSFFKENPGYAVRFYLEKHLSQWADGTYASRQATLATYGGRRAFFDSLYEGSGSRFFIEYCNIYQNLLYLGGLLFSIEAFRKRRDELPLYLGLIGVAGGFLFHIIWEANARYIFLYSLLLMPYAAKGLELCFSWLSNAKNALNAKSTKKVNATKPIKSDDSINTEKSIKPEKSVEPASFIKSEKFINPAKSVKFAGKIR